MLCEQGMLPNTGQRERIAGREEEAGSLLPGSIFSFLVLTHIFYPPPSLTHTHSQRPSNKKEQPPGDISYFPI